MVTSADKTTKVATVSRQSANSTFFRKAGDDSFFGKGGKDSFFPASVQAKLTVSTPDDPQEKEADAMAEKVMRMPEGAEINRHTEQKEKSPVGSGQLTVSRKESDAANFLHRKSMIPLQSEDKQSSTAASFTQTLSASKGGGSPLPGDTQEFMESRFGADFSGVRIHNNPAAADMSRSINAQAFAHGGDIYFNSGKFSPGSAEGKTLLAHELTHTIQQGASKPVSKQEKDDPEAPKKNPTVLLRSTATPEKYIAAKSLQSRSTVDADGVLHLFPTGEDKTRKDEKILTKTSGETTGMTYQSLRPTIASSPGKGSPISHDAVPSISPATLAGRGPPLARSVQQTNTPVVQRAIYDAALGRVGEFLSDIPLTVDIDEAKRWLIGGVRRFASYIPGYRALGVVLGYDPISGEEIARNGHNFIAAGLDIIPGGNFIKQKLEETGLPEKAAQWIDTQIAVVAGMVSSVRNEFSTAWNALGISSILDGPTAILRNLGGILERAINNVIDFARRTATELVEMIKGFLLNEVVGFVKQHTNAYELLKVILGKDPITDEPVLRNGTNILNALLEMGGDAGREQRRQMQETHSFEKAAAWIDRGIAVFGDLYDAIRGGFNRIWNIVSIDALMHPINTFNQIYEVFASPVSRVLNFVAAALDVILGFIKEALMTRLSAWARTIKGFPLVTVLIGKDPFTSATVPRTVENIIRGFMSLMEGGEEQFNQLQQSGAIARTMQRINAAVERLNMTPEYIIQLFTDLWNSFSFSDLSDPMAAFNRIMARFGEPIRRLIAFIVQIVRIVVEVVLQIMNFPSELIANIIARAMQAFEMIKRDPVGFLKNLLAAIKKGFVQFFGNIGKHLISGLQAWLVSELKDAGVQAPTDFTLRGIIGWVLQLLGITMEKIWEKLAQHPRIGPERVARIRGMIDKLDGIWTFIKDVQQRGIAAIWERIQEKLTSLWDTLLDSIKSWIMEQIVDRVTAKLLSMLDPTGIMAVINGAIALYKAIQSFIRYLRQMLEIVNSFVEGVVQIASGNISIAANFLERSMARGVPIMIGFLANQVGLGGLGKRIGEMIGRVRAMVDMALTWLVNKAVTMGMGLLDKLLAVGRSAAGAVLNWLGIREPVRMTNGEEHTLYIVETGGRARLMMASTPRTYLEFVTTFNASTPELTMQKNTAIALANRIDSSIDMRNRRDGIDGNLIATLIRQLAVITRQFTVNTVVPPSVIEFGPLTSEGGATFAFARVLSKNHVAGSTPQDAAPIWSNANRRSITSVFIRGHLLNHNIGGPGLSNNLTPITGNGAGFGGGYANRMHLESVEKFVKTKIDADKVLRYKVRALYRRHAERPFQTVLKGRIGTPAEQPLDRRKIEIMNYEQNNLCAALLTNWATLKNQGGNWVDDEVQTDIHILNVLPDGDFDIKN